MYKRTRTLFVSLLFALASQAQHVTNITPLPGERWWGGATALGSKMPLATNCPRLTSLTKTTTTKFRLCCSQIKADIYGATNLLPLV